MSNTSPQSSTGCSRFQKVTALTRATLFVALAFEVARWRIDEVSLFTDEERMIAMATRWVRSLGWKSRVVVTEAIVKMTSEKALQRKS